MKGSIGGNLKFTKGWKIPSSAKENGVCPACGSSDAIKPKGVLKKRKGTFGEFLGCSRYPNCKYTKNLGNLNNMQYDTLKRTKTK